MSTHWHDYSDLTPVGSYVPGAAVYPRGRSSPEGLIVGVTNSDTEYCKVCVLWPGEDPIRGMSTNLLDRLVANARHQIQAEVDAEILRLLLEEK